MNMDIRWPLGEISQETYRQVLVTIADRRKGRDFELTVDFDITDKGVAIKRISADVDQDTSGDLTSDQLRDIKIGDLRASIQRELNARPWLLTPGSMLGKLVEAQSGTATEEEFAYFSAAQEAVESATEHLTLRPKRGRGVDNQDLYRDIAEMYLKFYEEHGQRVVKAMAESLGRPKSTVSWWVAKARDHDWLTDGEQGKAGARPGDELLRWREEQEEEQ